MTSSHITSNRGMGITGWIGRLVEKNAMKEYVALLRAKHIAVLINPALAAHVTERIVEANALNNCPGEDEFVQHFKVFRENWDGEKMAEAIRKLS